MPFFQVKLRRSEKYQVKPNAEQIDGRTFQFVHRFIVDEGLCKGEAAWMPDYNSDYPPDAPAWVSEKDLELL
jgi:hypothetical protein